MEGSKILAPEPKDNWVITVDDKGNETKYKGEFQDGKKHGQGEEQLISKVVIDEIPEDKILSKYKGEFKDGKKHGQGEEHFGIGSVYVG